MAETPDATNATPQKGRPTFGRAEKDHYLELLAEGNSRAEAARQTGVHPATVRRHLERDPQFAQEVALAEEPAYDEPEPSYFERRPKFDQPKKDSYLEHLREGAGRHQAAHHVGVHPSTVSRHMTRDPEFAQEVSLAERMADDEVVNALYLAATSGNVTAIQVWLYNRRTDEWADRRNVKAEVSGPDGGPIPMSLVDVAKALQ